jgi:hypothetical protein
MTSFGLRRLYTRKEIADAIGGGIQDCLPHRDGRVACACLVPEESPDAPHVVLPGRGPDIIHWASVFAGQSEFVPVFLQRAADAWQYVGNFRVAEQAIDAAQIERWETVSRRPGGISMILFLEQQPQP